MKNNMIYILMSEDRKTVIPFQGSEAEMEDLWEKMATTGHRINRIDHCMIWTANNHPFLNVDTI